MSDEPLLPDEALQRIDTLQAAVDRAEAAGIEYSDAISIHFLKNFTVEPVEPYLKFHILREAIEPTISHGGYDTILQEVLDPASALRAAMPDIVVLALELTLLDSGYGRYGWSADDAIDRLHEMYEALRSNTTSLVVVNTMLSPFIAVEGIANPDRRNVREVARLNDWIWQYAAANAGRFAVADWDRLLRVTGRDDAIDQRFWRTALAPFRGPFLDLYAREIAKVVRALKGKSKKCVILDCDDTLWGGVVGEDGIDNIRLSSTDWPGSAYHEFQRSVLLLHERGILVALCSKNNPEDVWEVMQRHASCPLQRSHLCAWRINWDDKANNVLALSEELKLPLDAFVFVDDNPREVQLIRDFLPQVTVLQVPAELYDYPDLLLRDGLFDVLSVSEEDGKRASLYRAESKRSQERDVHLNLEDYLVSLAQELSFWEVSDSDRPRVTQLTQKTNQFNLTTRRYSDGQIEAFMNADDTAVYAMSVSDRYGDLGTTGVLIARCSGTIGQIDTLLLSCRILGRRLEFAFVDSCLRELEERWGVTAWRAEYLPTKKNAQVADFWDRVGFSREAETDSMTTYSMAAGKRSDGYGKVMSIARTGKDAGTN